MIARSRISFLKILHIIHESFSLGIGISAPRSSIFIFKMRVVLSRSRKFGYFEGNQIGIFVSARVASFLILVIIKNTLFLINCRTWSRLNFHKSCSFSELPSYLAPRIRRRCIKISFLRGIIVWGRGFFSLSQILASGRTNNYTIGFLK